MIIMMHNFILNIVSQILNIDSENTKCEKLSGNKIHNSLAYHDLFTAYKDHGENIIYQLKYQIDNSRHCTPPPLYPSYY